MCFAVFAAITAAMNSASVELRAVSDCVFDLHTTAPPECVNACPVVDWRLARSFAHAASTNLIDFPCSICSGCFGKLSVPVRCAGQSGTHSLLSWLSCGQACCVPQSFVALRYLATFFKHVQWNANGFDPNFDNGVMAYPMSGRQVTHAHIILPRRVQ